jgi:hypothetical protein
MNRRACFTVAVWFGVALPAFPQALSPGQPVAVRVLYDNSGSMYPGYKPPGSADRRTRAELGVGFFHESPRFVDWLDDFAKQQTIVDGDRIGMWTFTSNGQFTPSDIRQVHPVVPVSQFDAGVAVSHFPERAGDQTYLTEAVEAFARDFTGVLWLITDNIVETNTGAPDAGVQTFFETLAARREIRAVHLLKYSFEERGHTAAIAVYGMLISPQDVSPATLEYYDGKFRMLRDARRAGGGDLFPGREYLKLKDLHVGPLHPELRLVLAEGDKGWFKEGQTVQLEVEGSIRSYLTQHTVTAGHYELEVASPFEPESWAQRDLGAQSLSIDRFETFGADLDGAIPPAGSREVKATLQSRQPVSFSPKGPAAWLRLAWNGANVRYTGMVRMSFAGVRVRLEPQRMAGIFGIDHAGSAFAFQDVKTLPDVPPARVPVSFALRTGSSRTAVLLLILILAAIVAAAIAYLLSRKRTFHIALSREPERLVALRPLSGHDVVVDGKLAGRLSRRILTHGFRPVSGDAAITVTPAKDEDAWDVKIGSASRRLTIKAEGGGRVKVRPPGDGVSRVAPPPPPAPRAAPPPIPGRPPRAGRN